MSLNSAFISFSRLSLTLNILDPFILFLLDFGVVPFYFRHFGIFLYSFVVVVVIIFT